MNYPTVSVVLPIRNEARHIGTVMDAILGQTYPMAKLEVLVVDGMSDDGTRGIVEQYASRYRSSPSVRLIDNPERIVPTGMNRGIRSARGEIVVRIDGHAIVESDYIERNVNGLLDTGADCVGGIIESVGDGTMGKAIAIVMSSRFGVGGSEFRTSGSSGSVRDVDTVPFGTFRREVFERVGLFNEHFVRHQDYELNYRIRAAGGRIALVPSIRSVYHVRSSLARFIKQYWQYGIWKGRFLRRYPNSMKLRHLIPPLFVASLLTSGAAAVFWPHAGLLFGGILAAYSLFLAAAVADAFRRGLGHLGLLMPLLLPILHFSWGTGVLVGITRPRVGDAPTLTPPRSPTDTYSPST